jgi:hypothetical protein
MEVPIWFQEVEILLEAVEEVSQIILELDNEIKRDDCVYTLLTYFFIYQY